MSAQSKRIIELLQAKQREDPEGFRNYLPGMAELLSDTGTKRYRPRFPFGLTEQERSFHLTGLLETLSKLDKGAITSEEASDGLQRCANLIRDDVFGLPDEADYERLRRLVKAAIGKSPGSYKSKTTIVLGTNGSKSALEHISVVRGVRLDLDKNRQLVSISIDPKKFRERRKLLEFVGAFSDGQSDVAMRHDEYLAMQDPHGVV